MVVTYCQECQCSLSAEPIETTERSTPQEVELEYVYYKIRGTSFSELKEDILYRRGPLVPKGQRSTAYTEFHLQWKYDSKYKLNFPERSDEVILSVKFSDIVVSISHKITMPALDDSVKLSPQDAELWDRYFEKLKQHESDHVSISSDPEILGALKAEIGSIRTMKFGFNHMPSRADFLAGDIITLGVNTVGKKYVALIQKRYGLFDDLTKYGEADYDRDKIFKKIHHITDAEMAQGSESTD